MKNNKIKVKIVKKAKVIRGEIKIVKKIVMNNKIKKIHKVKKKILNNMVLKIQFLWYFQKIIIKYKIIIVICLIIIVKKRKD